MAMASGVTSSGSLQARRRLGVRIATFTLTASLALAASAGCPAAASRPLPGNGGDRVVVLTSATVHEPRPALTGRALAELRTAADSTNVSDTVIAATAHLPGLDLLQGMDDAVTGSDHGVLIVVSNGLSTSGGFDLRQVGWQAEPHQIVVQLRDRDLLPDLSGWRVLFTGLGATIGDRPDRIGRFSAG